MEAHELANSSWGKPDEWVDVRALRRYQTVLSRIAYAGEVLVFVLLVGVLVGTILLSQTNFENVIFYDNGTEVVCILDGRTGEIVNVQ